MATALSTIPSIFGFLELGDYLTAWLAAKRAEHSSYTLGRFAKRASLSPSHVRNVFNGNRDLQGPCVDAFIRALGLRGYEPLYFATLCRYARSASLSERAMILRELAGIAVRAGAPLEDEHVLACWLDLRNMIAMEAAHAPAFRDDPQWLGQVLEIHPEAAAGALRELKAAGLLVQEVDGRWRPQEPALRRAFGEEDPLLARLRRFALSSARSALDGSLEDRRYASMQFPICVEDLPEAQRISETLFTALETVLQQNATPPEADVSAPSQIYALQVSLRTVGRPVAVLAAPEAD